MLLAAWATGRLYYLVEMDADPVLEVMNNGVQLGLLEVKSQPTGGHARACRTAVVLHFAFLGAAAEALPTAGASSASFLACMAMLPSLPLPARSPPAAIKEAVRQLQAHGNILLLALALSNAALLQRGPLRVVGTVVVAVGRPTQKQREHWERRQLAIGGRGPAPKATMQLRIQR